MYTLFYVFSHSCFISDIGVFFGAFLIPIILIMIFNVCIFITSSYVVIKLKINQQKRNQARTSMKKTNTCKLLALLAGFMFLLGLSWLILMFTVVGADTNIYAAFAIQWLFVFFNSLQGFFLFVFFVALNRDARKLWLVQFHYCLNIKTRAALMKYRNSSTTGNTASTKLTSDKHCQNNANEKIISFNETAGTTNSTFEMKDAVESGDNSIIVYNAGTDNDIT